MPATTRSITAEDVRSYLRKTAFSTTSGVVGAEIEWLAFLEADPSAHAPFDVVRERLHGAGPLTSRLTFEPGGQVELSTPPSAGVAEVCDTIARDLQRLRQVLRPDGITLEGLGLDPVRPGRRVLQTPRYAAMEQYFDAGGPAGRRMMSRTAAIQVNLDAGPRPDDRWELAHVVGPVLAAMFANSPFVEGRPSPWRSARLATWWAMDRTRTAPVPGGEPAIDAWTRYALEANVMLIRVEDDRYQAVMDTLPFERWISEGHALGYPTHEDLLYHLTTLFPPIRARGWLELRMIDAQQDPWWRAAIAVPAALLYDSEAGERARAAAAPAAHLWLEAFAEGLRHPVLDAAARACMSAAIEAMPRIGADVTTIVAAREFAARYTERGRCPADDLIDDYHTRGVLPPFATMPAPVRS